MKKLLSLILVLAALLALAVPACAAANKDAVLQAFSKSMENVDCESSVNSYGRVVTVEMWPDGINALIVLAKTGEKSAVEAWDKLTASIAKLHTAFQEMLNDNGLEDHIVIVEVLGDKTRDRILYSIVDGFVAVDVVAGESGKPSATPSAKPAATPTPDPAADLTMGQRNAIRKAESYLNLTAFSRSGLIEQLEYSGFSHEEAVFAVDHIAVDWFEQAVKKAESYLSLTAFSRSRLIEQLEYVGFSHEQAEYAVEQVGY